MVCVGFAISSSTLNADRKSSNRKDGSPSLPAKGIQSKFEEADADVLLLYDCCNSAATAASASSRGHKGVTEVVAACGYETIAPEVGEHSFSHALTEILAAASKGSPISIAELHAQVIKRLKCWMPSFIKDDEGKFKEDRRGRLAQEFQRRRTPIYGILCETEPRRSIAIGPLKSAIRLPSNTESNNTAPMYASSEHQTAALGNKPETEMNPRKRKRSEEDPSSEDTECPQILLAIRLDKEELDIAAWKECLLRQLPPQAKGIKIEGIYKSFSTLLLLRVPVSVWDLLPSKPAYSFVGFVTSNNMALDEVYQRPIANAVHGRVSPATGTSNTHIDKAGVISDPPGTENVADQSRQREVGQKSTPMKFPVKNDEIDDHLVSTRDVTLLHQEQALLSKPQFPEPKFTLIRTLLAEVEGRHEVIGEQSSINVGWPTEIPGRKPDQLSLFSNSLRPTRPRFGSRPKVKSGCLTCKVSLVFALTYRGIIAGMLLTFHRIEE